MTRRAYEKIAEGLNEALAYARGEMKGSAMMLDDLILRALMHIIEQNDLLLQSHKGYCPSSEPLLEEIRTWMKDTHYSAQR